MSDNMIETKEKYIEKHTKIILHSCHSIVQMAATLRHVL